jgi:RNA polymerase sigma-70 factor (sigma-E family)
VRPSAPLEAFCESNKERLVALLTLHCGDRHIAEELAQETLAKVCLRWPSVRRMSSPEAWMFRVALNLSSSYWRRLAAERKAKASLGGEDAHHPESDPTDAIAVRQALSRLPKRQRSVLVLRFYADLSVREVAETMDMPEGTVKTLTRRALTRLRDDMNPIELKEVPNVG